MSPRLWVTGVGLATPLGTGVETTWTRLVRGERAIGPVTLFDTTGQRAALAAEVAGVTLPNGPPELRALWSRTSVLALGAAREAIRSAKLDVAEGRTGLVVSGTTGGMFETERLLVRLHLEGRHPEALIEMQAHPLTATGDRLGETLGPFVRVRTLSSACSGGGNALVVAAAWLLTGQVDAVVAGGSDALCRLTLSGFNALGVLDTGPCRPFDRRRRGTNLGEGAGFLVLESAIRARRRRAEPVAELAGWALGSEAHHITNPAPDGAVVASLIRRALSRGGLSPSDVDYVSAHATGTLLSDATEAAALAAALGAEVRRIPVSSSKGQIGHTLGAAGAIEAAFAALAVARCTLVPTVGLEEPDPACDLVHVPRVGRKASRVRAALSNAFGFGGMDTVVLFTEPELGKRDDGEKVSRASVPERLGDPVAVVTSVSVLAPCGLLGAVQCAELPERPGDMEGSVDLDALIDPVRGRRLDRAARLGAAVATHAAAGAGAPMTEMGVVLGNAFGNVDDSAAFLHRVFEKGPRSASPAEFPNLVPSSPVGHVTIYAGSHGPAFATTDLATSGECAFLQSVELVAAGEAALVIAGATDPRSEIVERVLAPLFAHALSQRRPRRIDLSAALVVEASTESRRRGKTPLALVVQLLEWRADASAISELLAPSSERAEVILPRTDGGVGELIDRTAWRGCPRLPCAPAFGESDALGAVAIAVAAARLSRGPARSALVVGLARDRGYAIVLAAP